MSELKWWVYVVRCQDGSLYTGIAKNLLQRIVMHTLGRGAKYTRSRRPVTLEFCRRCQSRRAAAKFEVYIKHLTREQKEQLIKMQFLPS